MTSVTVRSVPGYLASLQRVYVSGIVDGNGLSQSLYGVLKYIGTSCKVSLAVDLDDNAYATKHIGVSHALSGNAVSLLSGLCQAFSRR